MATVAVDSFWYATCHVIKDGFHTELGFFWVTGKKQIEAQCLPPSWGPLEIIPGYIRGLLSNPELLLNAC